MSWVLGITHESECATIDITKTFRDKRIACEIYTTYVFICLTLLSLDSSFSITIRSFFGTPLVLGDPRCRHRMKRKSCLLVYYRINNRY